MYVSATHGQVRDMARQFADEAIRPQAEALDREERFPGRDLCRRWAELGLFGIGVPEEQGGAGIDTLAYALVMEELSRGYASVADQCGLVELVGTLLVRHGTRAAEALWLKPLLTAAKRVRLLHHRGRSRLRRVRHPAPRAERDGAGWRLNGGKIWIHNAPVADLGFVLARTDKAAGHQRHEHLHRRSRLAKASSADRRSTRWASAPARSAPCNFDDVELPPDALLGDGGPRLPHDDERARQGPRRHRGARRRHRPGRARGGARLRPAAQAVRQADRRVPGRAMDARRHGQGHRRRRALLVAPRRRADRRGEHATMACSMAKCFAGDVAVAQTANAVQIFGGTGYISGFEVERLYRDAKITPDLRGHQQIQRIDHRARAAARAARAGSERMRAPVALVTGAGRGIGRAIARGAGARGFDIALNERSPLTTPSYAATPCVPVAAHAWPSRVAGDIADLGGHEAIAGRGLRRRLGRCRRWSTMPACRCCSRGDLLDVSPESYDRCMAVNARGTFFLTQAFAQALLARHGRRGDRSASQLSSPCHRPTPSPSRSIAANIACPRRRPR